MAVRHRQATLTIVKQALFRGSDYFSSFPSPTGETNDNGIPPPKTPNNSLALFHLSRVTDLASRKK